MAPKGECGFDVVLAGLRCFCSTHLVVFSGGVGGVLGGGARVGDGGTEGRASIGRSHLRACNIVILVVCLVSSQSRDWIDGVISEAVC